MKTRKYWCVWVLLLASFAFVMQASSPAKAQDQPPQEQQAQDQPAQGQSQQDQAQPDQPPQELPNQNDANDQDPPGRVARLNYSQGAVSFQAAGEGDWVTAVPNRPMVSGDNLWADENSRAEVHIGSTALRLAPKTGITFLEIGDNATQIRLAQGSLFVHVGHVDDEDAYEVDTPNIAFTLLQPGDYRVDVSADGNQTVTTVWQGRGQVTGGGLSYNVIANQSATFTGSDHLDYDLAQLPTSDDFDQWAFDRDAREDRADSANYVSREMTGYEDLDDSGDWSYVAGYGECWRPRAVVAGWAPYRYGHWAWVGPWGWTWVEDEPWGFAPFHYGRWASVGGGWFWVPGPVVVRPIWAPALVAFVGGGEGFHFSVGVGVGWFPLGPGEVFIPGYRVSRGYVNSVNLTNTRVNITQITNAYNTVVINKTRVNNITYVNQHGNNGVTVVSHDAFVNARPVAQNIMRVDAKELAAAPITHRPEVEPVRQSVIGAGHPVTVRPPTAVLTRQVVAQRTPPALPRSIEQRQAQAGGHLNQQTLVRQEMLVRPETQPTRSYQPNQVAKPQPSQDGFHSFGESNGNNQARPGQPQRPVYEQQGTAQPENRNAQPQQDRNTQTEQPNRNPQTFRPPQPNEVRPTPLETHPLVRSAPPVQERTPQQEQEQEQKSRTWQQQRPASPPPQRQQSRPAPRDEKPPKK